MLRFALCIIIMYVLCIICNTYYVLFAILIEFVSVSKSGHEHTVNLLQVFFYKLEIESFSSVFG